jgi:hypothetical protein
MLNLWLGVLFHEVILIIAEVQNRVRPVSRPEQIYDLAKFLGARNFYGTLADSPMATFRARSLLK